MSHYEEHWVKTEHRLHVMQMYVENAPEAPSPPEMPHERNDSPPDEKEIEVPEKLQQSSDIEVTKDYHTYTRDQTLYIKRKKPRLRGVYDYGWR